MNKNFTLKKWAAESTGVSVTAHGISIHAELYGQESNGILLYDSEDAEPVRIDFTDEMKLGSTYRCLLSGSSLREYTYLFHEDGKPVTDLLAKRLSGHRYFGEEHLAAGKKDALKRCVFVADQFNWQGDKKPGTAYEDSVYYGMHVRGFTKDASSRVKEAGTFAGIQKKIPYLKKLGITGIVLQPVYEFEECMKKTEARTAEALALQPAGEPQTRLNYWGYLPGYYLAPKNAYAYSDDAVTELKTLVRQLHKNSLEVILQFYFEPYMSSVRIREILLYWLKNYHIDGFELMGAQLPLREIALEPEFSECKLWSEWFPYEEIEEIRARRAASRLPESGRHQRHRKTPIRETRRLADFGKEYQNTVRRFLKGDGGVLSEFLRMQRKNPQEHGRINFLATYNGFRLADVFSYNEKHNEANGEENRDGEDVNYSWNCGAEGETRRKSVLALRTQLMKNALIMLFTAQGTPFLFMGDEWGKSSGGNNNPYCQDNEVTWQKWSLKKTEKELLSFTMQLIALRRAHGIMHQRKELRLMDYLSCGYPDLSYHGQEAWRTSMEYHTRSIGVLLCGKYCVTDGREDECLYIAYNMHWEPHDFALPKLMKGKRWNLTIDTAEATKPESRSEDDSGQSVTLPGRCVRIYISEETPKVRKTAGCK